MITAYDVCRGCVLGQVQLAREPSQPASPVSSPAPPSLCVQGGGGALAY